MRCLEQALPILIPAAQVHCPLAEVGQMTPCGYGQKEVPLTPPGALPP